MGSCGWRQCYWCPYWVYDPYLFEEPAGAAFCNWCWDWCEEGGGPYEPTARQRGARLLERWFLGLPDEVYEILAEYLLEWHDP